MKCLKNKQTGNIIRVSDIQADQMVGSIWSFVSKSEWKSQVRVKTEEQAVQEVKKEKIVSEKALKHSKLKAKQRPADTTVHLLKK